MPVKPCKYCGSLKHWPFQCYQGKRIKPLKKTGKHFKSWQVTRKLWFKNHPQTWYDCYICGKKMSPVETTLDHVIPRSRRPDLRYEPSNLKPCCWTCNGEKGSRVLTNT